MRNYQGMDRTGYSPRSYGGAASLAVAANVPSRPRCSDGASPVSGRRSSSAHASPQATATSPNSRAHQVVAAAARSNSAGAGRSAASSSAAGSTRTRSTAAVAAAKMPDDAQHSPLRLLPVAITAAAAAAGRSSPGSPTITAASSRVRRTSEVKEQATAVAGGARSRSPTSLGGKGPGSPSPSNQFLQPARFPSSNDATPADAGTPPSLDKSQSSSRQPAAVWRNSLIAIVGPSAQPDTAENSLVLPQAVAGTVAGRSKSPAKMPTYAPSHALLKPSSNSPGLPWSGGGTAAATMTPEIPFLGARRPVSPTVDMSNTTGNGKGRWQPTLPQQLPSEVAMAVPGQSLMKARSASPALARSATAAGSVDGRARQLASAADRSPTVSTTNALERTPAPSIAGASPRHAGVTSHPATAPAATGAYRTPPVKVSPPRRWRPAGSAPQRVAKGSAVAAAHRCTSAGAKTTIRDPATLTNAVQELRAAVAARSLSLALQTNGTSPNQRVRSRPVPTTVTPSRHGQAKSPGHSESPAAPDQQPQSSGKDPTPRVPERRKVAAAAATTTTARVGELFRPMRQENQQQHYRQKRQQPLSPPPSSAPADTLRETSSPMEHSRPPCSVPSSPDTASAATPESDRVLEPRQRTLTQRDGLMHQAGHFRPPFQYPRVDASPSGRLPQALSDMHHRCANGDGVDRESHGLIDSSASSLESPLQGPIRHPGAAEAAIAATGLSTRSGDALPSVLQRLPQPSHHPQRQPSSRSPQREYHGAHADSSESLFAMAAVAAAEARPGIGSATFGRWVQPTPAEGQLFLSSDVMPSDILSWQSSSTTRDLGHRRHGAHGVERGGGDQGRAGCAGGGGGSDRDRGGNGEEKRGGDRKDNAGPSGSNDRSGIGGDGGGEDPSDSSDGDGDGDDDMGEASEQAEGEEEDQDNASELSLRNKAVAAASTARAVIRQKPAADGFPPAAAASRAAAELDTDTQSPRKYRSPPRVRPRSGAQFPERGGDESQFNSDGSHDSNHFTGGAARVHRHHGRSGAGGTGKVPIQARPQPQPRESASPLSPSSPLASSPLPYTTMATARAATDAAAASHAAARAKFGSSPSPSPSPSPATAGSSPPSSRVGQRSRPPSPLSASASPSLREADLVARCRELEGQLAGVYREMDELVSRAQGTKGVVSNGADDLRQQLATMEAALAALEAENRELREAVRHSRTTYENAAALAAKMARLQEKVDLLTLDKRELEVQLDLARLSPRSATPGKGTSPRPSPPDTAHQQQHIIEALLEQVAELQQEKAALQEQLTQRAGLQQQQQQHQPAYKSARKGYAAATATATAPASAAADSGSTPRTVPRTAPAQVAAYPPPRSRSQSRSPLASPAAANASKVAGKSGSRGDADGVMMARIAQLQRQVRVLTAENDSLRCQGAVARAGPSEHQAQIRNLQGQVQSLGQQLESERWVRSHLNDMQAQAAGPTTAHQRQSPPPVSQHTQQQAAPRRSSVSLPPPPQHQPQPHQSRQRQQQQPYGRVAKAIVYGPISSPPSGGKLVADFQVTVEPLGPGRQGRVASPAAREGGPSFMQDGYR
ncbi:hypothetical protein Vretimale_2234 [Volvox reticuliferus]|nr:hypothetical protein Vretimale_2234 [Volvox reticuliferus]